MPAPVLAGAVVVTGRRGRPRVRQARLRLERFPAVLRAGGTRRSVWDDRGGDRIDSCLDPRRPHARGGRVAALGRRHGAGARARPVVGRLRRGPRACRCCARRWAAGCRATSRCPTRRACAGTGASGAGAYLVPEAIVRSGVWLEWPSGERSALPVPAGLDERAAPSLVEVVDEIEEPGGEVIDRAVMAERRARRAEAAEKAQARVASEALRALDALELRGSELEAARRGAGGRARRAGRARRGARAAQPARRASAALRCRMPWAPPPRRDAGRATGSSRCAPPRSRAPATPCACGCSRRARRAPRLLRSERAAQEAELAEARARAAALEGESARAREQALAAAADLDEARRDFARRLEESGAAASGAEARAAEAAADLAAAQSALADREAELSAARAELEEVRADCRRADAALDAGARRAPRPAPRPRARRGAGRTPRRQLAEARAAAEAQSRAAEAELAEARAAAEAQSRAAAGRARGSRRGAGG